MRLVNRQKRVSRKAVNRCCLAGQGRPRRGQRRAELMIVVEMLGALALSLARVAVRPRSFRMTSAVHHLYRSAAGDPDYRPDHVPDRRDHLATGYFHFRKFGAESYVVDMVGILVLREIGVLIVAIMVAGRSGSAYTAELGSMKCARRSMPCAPWTSIRSTS